jgi:hypothetical protein
MDMFNNQRVVIDGFMVDNNLILIYGIQQKMYSYLSAYH